MERKCQFRSMPLKFWPSDRSVDVKFFTYKALESCILLMDIKIVIPLEKVNVWYRQPFEYVSGCFWSRNRLDLRNNIAKRAAAFYRFWSKCRSRYDLYRRRRRRSRVPARGITHSVLPK